MIRLLAFFVHKLFTYLLWFPFAVGMSLIAIIFAPVICWFMDKNCYLPFWLKWFEPTDTAWGCWDSMWAQENPTWSKYKVSYTFIRRNPAYGFLEWLNCLDKSTVTKFGSKQEPDDGQAHSGWFLLVSERGFFQFKAVLGIPFTHRC